MPNNALAREVERGEILRYLAEVYPGGATPTTLLHHMDYSGYTVDRSTLSFHITYLAEKGYALIDAYVPEVGHPSEVRLVKITPAGIDLLDRRKKGESGVRI